MSELNQIRQRFRTQYNHTRGAREALDKAVREESILLGMLVLSALQENMLQPYRGVGQWIWTDFLEEDEYYQITHLFGHTTRFLWRERIGFITVEGLTEPRALHGLVTYWKPGPREMIPKIIVHPDCDLARFVPNGADPPPKPSEPPR